MQIDTLRYFIILAESGSFYGGAQRAHLSPQGLNKAISSLETELETELIERSHAGVRLTKQGELFLEFARSTVANYHDVVGKILNTATGDDTPLSQTKVYSTYYPLQIGAGIRSGSLLYGRNPLSEVTFKHALDLANERSTDKLIVVDLYPNTTDGLKSAGKFAVEPLLTTRVGVVWRPDGPLSFGKSIHRSALADVPIALNSHKEMAFYNDWLFRDNPLSNVALRIASPRMLLDFVHKTPDSVTVFDSFGYLLSTLDPDMDTEGTVFTPLATPEAICQVGVLHRADQRPTERIRYLYKQMLEFLQAEFPEYYEAYPVM